MGLLYKSRNWGKKSLLTHCYCHTLNLAVGDTINNIPLLKDTLDMAYVITKLIKKSPKKETDFPRKYAELLEQMKHDFHVYDRYGLSNSENPLPNKVDCPTCISECYSE